MAIFAPAESLPSPATLNSINPYFKRQGVPHTAQSEETRVWQRRYREWNWFTSRLPKTGPKLISTFISFKLPQIWPMGVPPLPQIKLDSIVLQMLQLIERWITIMIIFHFLIFDKSMQYLSIICRFDCWDALVILHPKCLVVYHFTKNFDFSIYVVVIILSVNGILS